MSVCQASAPSHSAQRGRPLRSCPAVMEHLGGAAMCLSVSTVGSVFRILISVYMLLHWEGRLVSGQNPVAAAIVTVVSPDTRTLPQLRLSLSFQN